jgi:TorA maturation chaperone TorD
METFQETTRQRSDIYGFLSGIFRQELSDEQIQSMIASGMLNLLAEAGAKIELDFFKQPPQKAAEALAIEFTALFIGPGKHINPYESIYVPDSTGKVGYYWGECTADMKKWVEHYGLKLSGKFESIPDHISIELEFMQRLVEQEALAWERNDTKTAERCLETERAFFTKHIVKWLPYFLDRVIESANLDFYREVARVGKDFILNEENLLSEGATQTVGNV